MMAMGLPEYILLMVGSSEKRKGKPTITRQYFDLISGAIDFGRNRNHGKANNINKLLSSERTLRQPSSNNTFGTAC
jgi:hypothetical protein